MIARSLMIWAVLTTVLLSQTSKLFTVQETGTRSERVNIVILSEGYTKAQMPVFATHVNSAIEFLFTKEPWAQYRSYCNVYRIEIASNQNGCDNGDTSGSGKARDTYFNTGFITPTVTQLLTFGEGGSTKVFNLLNTHVPEYDVVIVLVNDTKYGGSGGSIAVASMDSSSAAIVEHEIGHSFAGLADEYDINYPGYNPAEAPNNTAQSTRALNRWNHWISPSTPVPTPETYDYYNTAGLFEGSMYRTLGWYRPHYDSMMQSLNQPCGQINREQFVLQFYARVHPLDSSLPVSKTATANTRKFVTYSVASKVPTSDPALNVVWSIDGKIHAEQPGNTFTKHTDFIGNGSHTITATVNDPTTFVRLDSSNRLKQTVTWNLTLSGQIPVNIAGWRSTYGADTAVITSDGLANLVKYALGIAANGAATSAEQPAGSLTALSNQSYLTLNVPRRVRRTDVTYRVEVSDDLVKWDSGSGHTVIIADTETSLVVRDASPNGSRGRRFIRLAVQAAP